MKGATAKVWDQSSFIIRYDMCNKGSKKSTTRAFTQHVHLFFIVCFMFILCVLVVCFFVCICVYICVFLIVFLWKPLLCPFMLYEMYSINCVLCKWVSFLFIFAFFFSVHLLPSQSRTQKIRPPLHSELAGPLWPSLDQYFAYSFYIIIVFVLFWFFFSKRENV